MLNLRVVGMDVAEIQIDSSSDWTWPTTNAATARHLVGNKRPNKAHVANTACLTSKLLPQPVTEPGCNLRLDSHADKLREPVRASSLVAQLFRFSHVVLQVASCVFLTHNSTSTSRSPQGLVVLSNRPPVCVALVEQRCELSSGPWGFDCNEMSVTVCQLLCSCWLHSARVKTMRIVAGRGRNQAAHAAMDPARKRGVDVVVVSQWLGHQGK